MPVVTKTIGSGGGRDYSTLASFEAAIDNTTYPSVNTTVNGECYNDSTFDITTGLVFDAAASNVDYIRVTAASGHRHDGTAGTGVTIRRTANSTSALDPIIRYARAGVIVQDVEITSSADFLTGAIYMSGSFNDAVLQRCLIYAVDKDAAGVDPIIIDADFTATQTGRVIQNNIIFNCQSSSDPVVVIKAVDANGMTTYVLNNTLHNNGSHTAGSLNSQGIVGHTANRTTVIKNNLVTNQLATGTAKCFDYLADHDISNNASSDATADDNSGVNCLVSIITADQYVSTASGFEDLHLKTGSDCIGAGLNLETLVSEVELDIDLDARDNSGAGPAWDIGADYFINGADEPAHSPHYYTHLMAGTP